MKIKILSKIMVGAVLLTSCNNWLDVTPQAQVNADKLFSTPAGFENALLGIYTSMTNEATYGKNMTWGFMDVLAQYYTVYKNSNHAYYDAAQYNYESGSSIDAIRNMWLYSYRSIANCNVLLESLEKKDPGFFQDNQFERLKAEALALRAYLHFDLLRAFAPSWKDNKGGMSIPYADSFSNKIHKQLSTQEVVSRILEDLEIARDMLKDLDPVRTEQYKDSYYHYQIFGTYPTAWDYRAYHMNYWAITGLMARVYNYMGDKEAYTYAKEIIDAAHDGYFTFTSESDLSGTLKEVDVVMKNEILFALNFSGVHKIFYSSEAVAASRFEINEVNALFPEPNDLRKLLTGTASTSGKTVSYKFADIKSEHGGKIPMIRMSEMYLIAAERLYEENPTGAFEILGELQEMRGVTVTESVASYDQLLTILTGEARREFLSEGQMFYWYKRLGRPVDRGAGSVTLTKQNFSVPMPSAEIEFGGRVEEYLK